MEQQPVHIFDDPTEDAPRTVESYPADYPLLPSPQVQQPDPVIITIDELNSEPDADPLVFATGRPTCLDIVKWLLVLVICLSGLVYYN